MHRQDFIHSNTDGSFTVGYLNSRLFPWEILQIAQENKYLEVLKGNGLILS